MAHFCASFIAIFAFVLSAAFAAQDITLAPSHATVYGYGQGLIRFEASRSDPESGIVKIPTDRTTSTLVHLNLDHNLRFLPNSVTVTAGNQCIVTQHSVTDYTQTIPPANEAATKQLIANLTEVNNELASEELLENNRDALWKERHAKTLEAAAKLQQALKKANSSADISTLLDKSMKIEEEAFEAKEKHVKDLHESRKLRNAKKKANTDRIAELSRQLNPSFKRHYYVEAYVSCFQTDKSNPVETSEDSAASDLEFVKAPMSMTVLCEANWVPQYLLHIDSVKETGRATFLARITQKSGVVWDGVSVELSTATEKEGADGVLQGAPKLSTLVLESTQQREAATNRHKELVKQLQETLSSQNDRVKQAKERAEQYRRIVQLKQQIRDAEKEERDAYRDVQGFVASDLPESDNKFVWETNADTTFFHWGTPPGFAEAHKKASAEESRKRGKKVREAEEIMSSVDSSRQVGGVEAYSLRGLHSVPSIDSDSTPAPRLVVGTVRLDCTIGRDAKPLLSGRVFLEANLTNNGAIALISGEATLFLDGRDTGTVEFPSLLNNGGVATISLGKDERMSVSRRVGQKTTDSSGGLLTTLVRRSKEEFKLFATNRRNSEVRMMLRDRAPTCSDKDVKINIDTPQTNGIESVSKDASGMLLWNVTVPPATPHGGPGQLIVSYTVELEWQGTGELTEGSSNWNIGI